MTRLYVAMRDSLAVVTGGEASGGGWRIARPERLSGHDLECVAAAPAAPERAFCGTFDAGLYRTVDGGDSWDRVGATAIEPESVMSVTTSPGDPDELWIGTEPSRVYRSRDGGDSWTERPGLTELPSASDWYFPPRPHTHHVRWIEPDPHDPDHLYVGIEAGALVQTHDGGRTWEDRRPSSRRDNHSLTTHPDARGRAWSAAGDGFAETRDGGETWQHPQTGLEHRYCWSVAVDPGDPETVLLSSASGPRAAHSTPGESYLYRRRGDAPWERLDDRGIPVGDGVLRAVLGSGSSSGTIYAANNRGIYRTADGGDSWAEIDVEWPSAFETSTVRGIAVVE